MKNKKVIILIAIILIVVVIVACIIFFNKKDETTVVKEITSSIGQTTWINANENLKVTNGDDEIVLVLNSDLNFDPNSTDYKYEIPYVLNVNGTEYTGSYIFGVGYTMHSEVKNMPYNVNMIDFKNGSVEVEITEKTE